MMCTFEISLLRALNFLWCGNDKVESYLYIQLSAPIGESGFIVIIEGGVAPEFPGRGTSLQSHPRPRALPCTRARAAPPRASKGLIGSLVHKKSNVF